MKDKIIERYIQICLETQDTPKNVYQFSKELGMEEKEFYSHFSSLEAIENSIFLEWFMEVKNKLVQTEIFTAYSAREKILAFYFAWFEHLLNQRSFIKFLFEPKNKGIPLPQFPYFLKEFRKEFMVFVQEIIDAGIESKELEDRKFLNKKYAEGIWMNYLFLQHFWLKDTSPAFEKTDAAIEKSVNLAFDLLATSPLDSLIDFGKFLFQNK
ncbi:MAG: TetR/AcrR family transcriptional regulator [Bacteroidia bacterium]|nr:TetR/AcrR family transcriptional regulator [Bacteroidia bacterium]MCF8427532.1 TetR/AcrR family transcriptional regulator [Bacteroidia bacterium]MCF8447155.1 TetR/AcrR family transcriptional regulator [Bacteroidia bacterium]